MDEAERFQIFHARSYLSRHIDETPQTETEKQLRLQNETRERQRQKIKEKMRKKVSPDGFDAGIKVIGGS